MPPLTVGDGDIDQALEILDAAVKSAVTTLTAD
jgi:4-aminobutyrate aminotransferase-like enzyme